MNTADAAGDVYFGLSQLLLPYMCTGHDEHMSLWCNNRKWLSGGTAWMVYRKFVIEAKEPFGQYSPCNPSPDTGVFSCGEHGGGSSGWPQVCSGYHEHHSHYLAGTPMAPPMLLPPNGSVAACCTTCSASKKCDGWVVQNSTAEKPECVLLSNGTLVNNPHGIVSAQKEGGGGNSYCWYNSNSTYAKWKGSCSMKNCSCDAISHLSLGLEDHVRDCSPFPFSSSEFFLPYFTPRLLNSFFPCQAMCYSRGPPHNRTLRESNRTHWWNYTGADCDSGVEEGDCDSSTPAGLTACKKKCLVDPYVGTQAMPATT